MRAIPSAEVVPKTLAALDLSDAIAYGVPPTLEVAFGTARRERVSKHRTRRAFGEVESSSTSTLSDASETYKTKRDGGVFRMPFASVTLRVRADAFGQCFP